MAVVAFFSVYTDKIVPELSGLLTKKFVNLIKHAEDGILDLNKAAETLEVVIFLIAYLHYLILYYTY